MPNRTNPRNVCIKCKKRYVPNGGTVCPVCQYHDKVEWMSKIDRDAQDWEFATCPECGSSFDRDGICRNQSCPNSPDLGKDWI